MYQYEIDPYCLESGDIKLVNELSDNVKRYLDYNASLKEITIDEVLPKLSLDLKMKMALSSILSMTNIPTRNEYIQKYIKIYTRLQVEMTKSNLWLYNKYNNQPILCKHLTMLYIILIKTCIHFNGNSLWWSTRRWCNTFKNCGILM